MDLDATLAEAAPARHGPLPGPDSPGAASLYRQIIAQPPAAAPAWRRRSLGIPALTAAAAAAVALALIPGTAARHAGQQPQTHTAAYVISRTETALSAAAAENPIVYIHTSDGSGAGNGLYIGGGAPFGRSSLAAQQTDAWYYGPNYDPARYQGFTAAGQPVFDSGLTQTPDTVVDYPARIWWRHAPHLTPWTPPHGSALPCNDVGEFATGVYDPTYWPADIRKLLACGQFTTAGTEQVDGVDAIKVTQVRPDGPDGMATVLWVDPSTYLPVRVMVKEQPRPGGPYLLVKTEDVQWLPPTAANLAKLTVPIPSGFVQVPAPPDKNCLGSAAINKCVAPWNAWYAKYVAPRL
jgi:hypothetical protein